MVDVYGVLVFAGLVSFHNTGRKGDREGKLY